MQPMVLVVASRREERARLAAWLEEGDYDVATCPGPRAGVPCVGLLGRCPVAEDADVVVLDLALEDDPLVGGGPGRELVALYLGLGLGVVALGSTAGLPRERAGLVRLPRSTEYGALVGAVGRALAR